MNPKKNREILKKLKKKFPLEQIFLHYQNQWELLVATILSAQCTDARVNVVTKKLFKKYKKLKDFAGAMPREFEKDIYSTGFYRNKTKNILASAKKIEKEFNGQVPQTMEELLSLPGVARKTANIVLSLGFGKIEGIAVDTHVKRLSFRLGFTKHINPNKVEQDLMQLVPQKEWAWINSALIEHGRQTCTAQNPTCPDCFLKKSCPSAFSFERKKA
ncbi:endonuclease III [Candidatus Micrarchaeota archaeon]|nr:endonuclease III [Candidatus Micrarchaeota archaeon]MBU1930853.1 endonuclease III [Candidatus Micrarchaeota archaeon]